MIDSYLKPLDKEYTDMQAKYLSLTYIIYHEANAVVRLRYTNSVISMLNSYIDQYYDLWTAEQQLGARAMYRRITGKFRKHARQIIH